MKILADRQRNSSIELLRILSMFFIVISHYFVHNGIKTADMDMSFNKLLVDSLDLGKLGVAIFVMITGYYMSKTKFKLDRIISVVLQTLFYSVAIFALFCIMDTEMFSIRGLINAFLPCITGQYWFVTTFVILSFLVPFINAALNSITKGQFILLLVVQMFIWSIAPTFLNFDSMTFGGYISYFVMFYSMGAYLRTYPEAFLSNNKLVAGIAIVSFVLLISSGAIIDIVGIKIGAFAGKSAKFYSIFSILMIFTAFTVLAAFVNIKPFYSKLINKISSCTFGVYLIHDNTLMRQFLWGNSIFNNLKYVDSKFLFVHFIISVLLVYFACTLIELLRKALLERYVFNKVIHFISNITERIIFKAERLFKKVL